MHHVTQINEFKVIDTCRGAVVINTNIDDYKAHAHFADIRGALECINLINRGLLPKSRYLIVHSTQAGQGAGVK